MTLLDISELPDAPVTRSRPRRVSRKSDDADFFAAYFRARANQEISAIELMQQRACLSFRTRISDLRYEPYGMDVRNRLERVKNADGKSVTHSFYRFVPTVSAREGE